MRYFYLKEYDKTLAEFDFESKNKLSHRGKAVRKMVQFLKGIKYYILGLFILMAIMLLIVDFLIFDFNFI